MTPQSYSLLAAVVLTIHLAVILFNVGGLVVIPLGAWRGWRFVRGFWWRAFHLASLGVVALQAVLGRICFLTNWQADLLRAAGDAAAREPLIAGVVNRLIFWPLPLSVFAAVYVAVCGYVLLLWWLVPPHSLRLRQIDSGSGTATRRR